MLEVFGEEVKTRAAAIDQKIKDGTAGKLAGMFLAIKDKVMADAELFAPLAWPMLVEPND